MPKPRYWEDPSNPDNESYGPFDGEEAVAFLKGVVVLPKIKPLLVNDGQ
ncbi:MAG: hypothetical protein QMC36_00135 [Patescibacteria group bacterium]